MGVFPLHENLLTIGDHHTQGWNISLLFPEINYHLLTLFSIHFHLFHSRRTELLQHLFDH